MVRLYLPVFLALFIVAVPKESAGQNGELAGLSEAHIVIKDLSNISKAVGITRNGITEYVFVQLRSRLPRLEIKKSATPYVYVTISVNRSQSPGYFGSVSISINRSVTINQTGKIVSAPIWNDYLSFEGPPNQIDAGVRYALDRLITNFAADWYRDNPPK